MSLEDGATFEIFFPEDFDPSVESVAKRLQLFNDFRLPRTNTTQLYSNAQMEGNAEEKKRALEEQVSNIRKFYTGPLMSMDTPLFSRERQDFFYPYNVFEQAKLAMSVKDRKAGLLQHEVRHFY